MRMDVKYIDDPETLRRWNFDEPAITFTDENQHVAVPLSKVNGYQIQTLLKEWITPISILLDNIKVGVSGGPGRGH